MQKHAAMNHIQTHLHLQIQEVTSTHQELPAVPSQSASTPSVAGSMTEEAILEMLRAQQMATSAPELQTVALQADLIPPSASVSSVPADHQGRRTVDSQAVQASLPQKEGTGPAMRPLHGAQEAEDARPPARRPHQACPAVCWLGASSYLLVSGVGLRQGSARIALSCKGQSWRKKFQNWVCMDLQLQPVRTRAPGLWPEQLIDAQLAERLSDLVAQQLQGASRSESGSSGSEVSMLDCG